MILGVLLHLRGDFRAAYLFRHFVLFPAVANVAVHVNDVSVEILHAHRLLHSFECPSFTVFFFFECPLMNI